MRPSIVAGLVTALFFSTTVYAQTANPCSATDPCCSASNPCLEGCCSPSGFCGYGPTFCDPSVCIASASPNGTCAQLSECDAGGFPGFGPEWGSKYAAREICPLHVCCSKFGFCGTTTDFCGTSTVAQPSCSIANSTSKRTIGYYEGWNYQRPCQSKLINIIPVEAYTHLNFAFMLIDPNSFEIVPMDDGQPELYSRFTALKKSKPGLETWLSIGGWAFNDPGPTQRTFSQLAASSSAQSKFFASLTSFMAQYGFDGVDIDWEYPGTPDRAGVPEDTANFVSLLKNLRSALDAGNYGLSITIPSSYWYMQWFDIVSIEPIIDWFNIMTYDLFGTWDSQDAFIGPFVFAHTNLTETKLDMDLLWRNNINPSKVTMGIGYYGRSYTLADPSCTVAGCPFTEGAKPGACTQTSGILSYDEILDMIRTSDPEITLDTTNAVQIAVWDGQWVGYDDPTTIKMKLDYANSLCLGGTMVWAIDLDIEGSLASALSGKDISPIGNDMDVVYVPPDIWNDPAPSVACEPPCTLILPPFPLGTTSIISPRPLTTSILSSSGGRIFTVPTVIPIAPFTISEVPLWPVTVSTAASGQIIPVQSIMPPSFTISLPGTETLMPVSSIDFTSIAISGGGSAGPSSTGGSPAGGGGITPVKTPSPVPTGITSDCTQFYKVVSGDTCNKIESQFSVTFQQFLQMNPSVGQNCFILVDMNYCNGSGSGSGSNPTQGSDPNPITGAPPSFPSTSHVVTIQPMATITSIPIPVLPLPFQTGTPLPPGGCPLDPTCGVVACALFGCGGGCGLFGCDGGCGLGFCGGGCGLGGCGPGCGAGKRFSRYLRLKHIRRNV
ncbi:glycoside hydrolase superfamily [Xylogone sp. PMI_703]|nr:glycoside hydrolase superfamily [Xylogone sp. PMI_703]